MAIKKHITTDASGALITRAQATANTRLAPGLTLGQLSGVIGVRPTVVLPTRPLPLPLPPRPTVPPPPQQQPAPPLAVPVAPSNNPFRDLPSPTAGSRIKSEDFRKLSQSLRIIYDANALSNTLFGHDFGEAKQALAAQQYTIQRVMSVFGTEIGHLADPTLDERKVIQVLPSELGERSVSVIVTEVVETRRLTPNIVGLTYSEASERLRAVLGDVSFSSAPMSAPQLVGLPLSEARRLLSR